MRYDCIIIGGGVVGCAVAYTLARFRIRTLLLEAQNDVAMGTTRANSAIVHAGYDPEPGSAMARTNLRGSAMMEELCRKLDVRYERIGSLVLGFSEKDRETLARLYDRGVKNGVPGLRLLDAAETRKMEPNLSENVACALYAPTAGIVDPWGLALAMAQVAVRNGTEVRTDAPVTAIARDAQGFTVTAGGERYEARTVVNAAGGNADVIHGMIGGTGFTLHPDKGAYYLLDKSQGKLVSHVIFQCPTEKGKGVLVSPTVHGNLIVGPDAVPQTDKEDVSTSSESLDFIRKTAALSVDCINYRDSIRNFAGLRARGTKDFIIGPSPVDARFINLAGIQSPGLSASPAIAEEAAEWLRRAGLALEERDDFEDGRRRVEFRKLSRDEQRALIEKNPAYGRVICRCETITEGEILDALHAPLPPKTIDGVKRRCGSGMGRCQGGFCGPRVHEILAREWKLPMEAIEKDRKGSYILTGETKGERA
ncbi:MAG: NAD(P)/FAD-dependent oxidoreductase [Eubacteriales bacterium]|nr:NAD(P)/FAD-dependent oxidoreductase [Eubacteriales bacterium]MDY5015098.1 NAD(P)/FAD-dependent oxidoreductase [Eubacteriales bacterium]